MPLVRIASRGSLFEETQRVPAWFYVMVGVMIVCALFLLLLVGPGGFVLMAISMVGMVGLTAKTAAQRLRTRVTPGTLHVTWGSRERTFDVKGATAERAPTVPGLPYGVERRKRLDAWVCTYGAPGGVLLKLKDGERVIVTSQRADELLAALRRASAPAPEAPAA